MALICLVLYLKKIILSKCFILFCFGLLNSVLYYLVCFDQSWSSHIVLTYWKKIQTEAHPVIPVIPRVNPKSSFLAIMGFQTKVGVVDLRFLMSNMNEIYNVLNTHSHNQ